MGQVLKPLPWGPGSPAMNTCLSESLLNVIYAPEVSALVGSAWRSRSPLRVVTVVPVPTGYLHHGLLESRAVIHVLLFPVQLAWAPSPFLELFLCSSHLSRSTPQIPAPLRIL